MLEISVHGSNNECDAYHGCSKTRLVDNCRVSTDRALRLPDIPHTVKIAVGPVWAYCCAGLYALHSTDDWSAQLLGGLWLSNFRMLSTFRNRSTASCYTSTYNTVYLPNLYQSQHANHSLSVGFVPHTRIVYVLQMQTHSESRRVWHELLRGGYTALVY